MAVSIVEHKSGAVSSTSTPTATLTTTPSAGDVVVAVLVGGQNSSNFVSASGMGATWTAGYVPPGGGSGQRMFVIGTGATTAGTVTLTVSAARSCFLHLYLVRGLTSTTVSGVNSFATTVSSFQGTAQTAGPGQIVIAAVRGNVTNAAELVVPSSGSLPSAADWTGRTVLAGSFLGAGTTATSVPSASHSFALEAARTSGTMQFDISQIVLGTAATTSPATGVGVGTYTFTGAALGKRDPEASGVGAYQWTGTAEGVSSHRGAGVGAFAWSGSAIGNAPTPGAKEGFGSGSYQWVGVAGGSAPHRGAASGAFAWVGVAVGAATAGVPRGVGVGSFGWVGEAAGDNGQVDALPWTLDESQQDRALVRDDDPVLVIVEAPPAAIPDALSPRLITRQSHQLDPAALEADPTTGQRRAPGNHTVVTEDVGYPHIWVDGRDVTYHGGARTRIGTITSSTPGGDGTTSLTFPTLTSLDQAGTGEWAWLRPGALVDIALVSPAGVRMTPHIFNGALVSDEPRLDTRNDAQTWAVVGTFAGADVQQRHRAPIVMNRIDLGLIIPRVLNKVVGRSYGPFASVRTDIRTNSRGTYAQSVWQYVSDLLARAWTTNGRQWTIRRTTTPRLYELALRDTTTTHWTVTAGAYGVEVDLDSDYSETYNVVYGHGIARDGYYWGNWRHPALSLVAPPPYPFNDPSTDIDVGTTDADTDTGDGVTAWQRRMRYLGYGITVDGVYSDADEQWARKIQKDRGLHVGGGVGPQTWNATFDEGTTGADLSQSYRAPLAWLPEVEPWLYAANGAIVAPNPAYDPSVERRESEDIDFGTGRSKAEGVAEAEAMLARNSDPGWVGTVTLRTDPWEGSRWFMFEDQNVMLLGHRGENRLMHIVGRSLDPESGQVTLTVDSKFRDALTVQQIRDRNKESRLDPARRPGNANRRSRLDQDILVPFDGESGAGRFYRRPVNGDAGLWSVVPVFISEAGQLVRISMRSSGPASKFWMAMFGSEKTAAWMDANVGDPSEPGAFDAIIEAGDTNGLIETWGNDSQACGETPGGSVNGRFEDTGGLSYYSTHGGWVWVAVYADESCFLEGRFYPAPIQ